MPRDESVSENAAERQRERAENVEHALESVTGSLDGQEYPVSSAELATVYADQPIDLPNETESLGSVFDRLDEEFDSPAAAREAVYHELTGEAAGPEEYNRERPIDELSGDGDPEPL
ncbi:hypothetical protein ACFQH6_10155 [Halobacteriaceae archaeon GCM10025711]